jgi:hypothetical protein
VDHPSGFLRTSLSIVERQFVDSSFLSFVQGVSQCLITVRLGLSRSRTPSTSSPGPAPVGGAMVFAARTECTSIASGHTNGDVNSHSWEGSTMGDMEMDVEVGSKAESNIESEKEKGMC